MLVNKELSFYNLRQLQMNFTLLCCPAIDQIKMLTKCILNCNNILYTKSINTNKVSKVYTMYLSTVQYFCSYSNSYMI